MNYAGIATSDIANGPGMRVSLFVSGCRNDCPGCFNKDAQDFDCGLAFDRFALKDITRQLARPEIAGLTVLGGEPLEPENQPDVLKVVRFAKTLEPDKTIWLYTGFVYEDLISHASRAQTEHLQRILDYVDVLVDGPFVADRRDLTLAFRGSSNQRLIDLAAMRAAHDMDTIVRYDV